MIAHVWGAEQAGDQRSTWPELVLMSREMACRRIIAKLINETCYISQLVTVVSGTAVIC